MKTCNSQGHRLFGVRTALTGITDEGRQDRPDWADRPDKATATHLIGISGVGSGARDAVLGGLGATFQRRTLKTLNALKGAERSTASATTLMGISAHGSLR